MVVRRRNATSQRTLSIYSALDMCESVRSILCPDCGMVWIVEAAARTKSRSVFLLLSSLLTCPLLFGTALKLLAIMAGSHRMPANASKFEDVQSKQGNDRCRVLLDSLSWHAGRSRGFIHPRYYCAWSVCMTWPLRFASSDKTATRGHFSKRAMQWQTAALLRNAGLAGSLHLWILLRLQILSQLDRLCAVHEALSLILVLQAPS